MATQVNYPGIYTVEFTPGAPIQGVGTSTAAFIGTASMGPTCQPTLLTSWDEFQNVFGGFIAEPANLDLDKRSYLAPAVYGFFQNQGTNCYIVRAVKLTGNATTLNASLNLYNAPNAPPPNAPPPVANPVLVVTALAEGSIGNSIRVTVVNSSLLSTMLGGAGNTLATKNAVDAGQLTLDVDLSDSNVVPSTFVLSQALPTGAVISINGGAEFATVANAVGRFPGVGTITLAQGLNAGYPAKTSIASMEWDLTVTAATTESFTELSMNPLHPNYWGKAVQSKYVGLSLPPSTTPSVAGTNQNPNPAPVGPAALGGGTDDNRVNDLLDIRTNPTAYLNLLTPIEDVNIVAMPGIIEPNAQQALVTHCETMRNRFAVLDAVRDTSVGFTKLKTQYGQVRSPDGFAAIYFPWIQVVNPLSGNTEYWPPSGHVAGVYAHTDARRGVHKAPANVPVAGALGLHSLLTNADQGPLNLLGINILRVFPEQSQPLVWGARTTSTDSDWQYVNIRRLFIYLEQSIEQGIRWAVFEPNNPLLWGKLKRTITEFLTRVQSDGGIISFYVRIDAALNPPATQALGQLYIEVGIQPAYPAEFIILRIGIWQGGSSVSES